jgi:transcriptional regulator with XRE-family HTH domain
LPQCIAKGIFNKKSYLKKIDARNELGSYLAGLEITGAEICSRTGISKSDLSKLSSGLTSRLTAEKFYSINRAVETDITDMLVKVFPNASLVSDWKQAIKNKKQEKTATPFGFFLLKEENSRTIISAKTGISVERLRDLSNKLNAEILAIELYLIELALNKIPGEVFEELFRQK